MRIIARGACRRGSKPRTVAAGGLVGPSSDGRSVRFQTITEEHPGVGRGRYLLTVELSAAELALLTARLSAPGGRVEDPRLRRRIRP